MKRIRQIRTGYTTQSVALYNVDPDGTPSQDGDADVSYRYTQTDRFMIDHKADGVWYYQDCTNAVRRSYFEERRDSVGNRLHWCYVANGAPTGLASRIAAGYPVSRLVDDSTVADYFRPYDLSVRGNLLDFERTFVDPSVPSEIIIDRDPFDTNFSIWCLVVDVFQLRGLVAKLFQTIVLSARFRELTTQHPKLTAKQLANEHLAIKFGLLPTISDLQQFCHLILNWQKRYDDLKGFLESTRAWHAKPYVLDKEFPQTTFSIFGEAPVGVFAFTHRPIIEARVFVEDRSFRRTASYSFSAPEFRGWSTRLKQFLDAFGVIDPAALWDVVPFSFIVDWFFGVGNWLHANRPRLFPASLIIRDYCESKKVVLEVEWYASYYGNPDGVEPPVTYITGERIATEKYTAYARRKFIPPAPRLMSPRLEGSGINLSRALISASLLAQRVPTLPRS